MESVNTMFEYVPSRFEDVANIRVAKCPSAWHGLETIVLDILNRFNIKRNFAIDFGVDHGYSTSVLSNYFTAVWGVDNFKGDDQTATKQQELFLLAQKNLAFFDNILLIQKDYKEFIQTKYYADLIHVDITHDFNSTYACGLWAAKHSSITIFHDTESFPNSVKPAVELIAKELGKECYNFPKYNGLGIIV